MKKSNYFAPPLETLPEANARAPKPGKDPDSCALNFTVTPEFYYRWITHCTFTGRTMKHNLIDGMILLMRDRENKMTPAEKNRFQSMVLQQASITSLPRLTRSLDEFALDPKLFRKRKGRPLGSRDREARLPRSF